jgi:hypothetical protein
MKTTTQKLFRLALDKLNYEEKKLTFGNYEIIRDYPSYILKNGTKVGVVSQGQVFMNSFWEKFLFLKAVEANIGEISDFFEKYTTRLEKERDDLTTEKRKLSEKVKELEEKLASAVAEKVDLDLNQTD